MFPFMSQGYCLINCLIVLSGRPILKECFQDAGTNTEMRLLFHRNERIHEHLSA